eukprot:scaffold71844_cov46-Phaeocystis_antarctica.AAC.2
MLTCSPPLGRFRPASFTAADTTAVVGNMQLLLLPTAAAGWPRPLVGLLRPDMAASRSSKAAASALSAPSVSNFKFGLGTVIFIQPICLWTQQTVPTHCGKGRSLQSRRPKLGRRRAGRSRQERRGAGGRTCAAAPGGAAAPGRGGRSGGLQCLKGSLECWCLLIQPWPHVGYTIFLV